MNDKARELTDQSIPSLPAATRLLLVATITWLLWLGIIAVSAPREPAGVARAVFLFSFFVAWAACVWATWHALPRYAGKAWRRPANFGLGLAAFAGLTLAGHLLGVALAAYLK